MNSLCTTPCRCTPCPWCGPHNDQLDREIERLEREVRNIQDKIYRLKLLRGARPPQRPLINPYQLTYPRVDDVMRKIK